jgi:hypothetical protein
VDARFERFTLTTEEFRNFVGADCELIEEFVRQVLPKLATRDVRSDIDCAAYRHRSNGSGYLVRGEILRALPAGEQRGEASAGDR